MESFYRLHPSQIDDGMGFSGRQYSKHISPEQLNVVTDYKNGLMVPLTSLDFGRNDAETLRGAYSSYAQAYYAPLPGAFMGRSSHGVMVDRYLDKPWDERIFNPDASSRRHMIRSGVPRENVYAMPHGRIPLAPPLGGIGSEAAPISLEGAEPAGEGQYRALVERLKPKAYQNVMDAFNKAKTFGARSQILGTSEKTLQTILTPTTDPSYQLSMLKPLFEKAQHKELERLILSQKASAYVSAPVSTDMWHESAIQKIVDDKAGVQDMIKNTRAAARDPKNIVQTKTLSEYARQMRGSRAAVNAKYGLDPVVSQVEPDVLALTRGAYTSRLIKQR